VFGPAVVIGGALSGAFGLVAARLFPWMHIQPGAFAMVGMAGFFAAAANTPISTIIMVSEMTGNYRLLVPSMWVCIIAYLLVRRDALYERQIESRFDTPVHLGNMMEAVLTRIKVSDAISHHRTRPMFSVPPDTTLKDLIRYFADLEQSSFPVVDKQGQLLGIVKGRELRTLLTADDATEQTLIAAEIARPPATVTPDDSLLTAIRRMESNALEEVIVVDARRPAHLLTMLSHHNIISAYHDELLSRSQDITRGMTSATPGPLG
jgi:CIC family chloride channel protein